MNAEMQLRRAACAILRELGFRNRGFVWNRGVGEIVQVIDCQIHRYAGDTSTQVTINVGLCHPEVWSLTWDHDAPDMYGDTDCCPRFRVGYLLGNEELNHPDKWWVVEDREDGTVKEILDVVTERCIPYLDRHSSLSAMQAVASRFARRMGVADRIYLAVINHLLGELDERDALFAQLLSRRTKAWHTRIEGVLDRLGLSTTEYETT